MNPESSPYFRASNPKLQPLGSSSDTSCPGLRGAQQGSAGGKGPILDAQEQIPSLESAVRVVARRGKRPRLCRQDTGLQEKEDF